MKYWRDNGTPVEKLRMGFATYGRTFRLSSSNTGVGAPASGPASAGPYSREAGFWAYYEVCGLRNQNLAQREGVEQEVSLVFQICTFLKGASVQWIDDQKVPYATKNSEWVGFDNKESYETKVGGGTCALHRLLMSPVRSDPELVLFSSTGALPAGSEIRRGVCVGSGPG